MRNPPLPPCSVLDGNRHWGETPWMGKFLSFIAGLIAIPLIVGGVAFYVLRSTGDTHKPIDKIEAPSGAGFALGNKQDSAYSIKIPKFSFEGDVNLAPHAAAAIKKLSKYYLRIVMLTDDGRAKAAIYIEKPSFPVHFSLPFEVIQIAILQQKKYSGTLAFYADICSAPETHPCDSILKGTAFSTASWQELPKESTKDAGVTFPVGNIVMNRLFHDFDLASCVKSGGTIRGRLQSTAQFVAKNNGAKTVTIVGVPTAGTGLRGNFLSSNKGKVSKAEMEKSGEMGIIFGSAGIDEKSGSPFSLKISKGWESVERDFFAVACKPGESEAECGARAFPAPAEYALSYPDRGLYRLVPAGFISPLCGDTATFHAHDWKAAPGSATLDSYQKANPPEVVDGLAF